MVFPNLLTELNPLVTWFRYFYSFTFSKVLMLSFQLKQSPLSVVA